MLKWLELKGVGPAPQMELTLAPRVNVLTGDNGVGKSFLLDIAWWALTHSWLGEPAWPRPGAASAEIELVIGGRGDDWVPATAHFQFERQRWVVTRKRKLRPGLVVYARADGAFAVWDPLRNGWEGAASPEGLPAYHFAGDALWDGLAVEGRRVCEGLIRDWVSWQKGGEAEFALLAKVLEQLSVPDEPLRIGQPARVHLGDGFDTPFLEAPYGPVPITHASAAVRRIVAIAYVLVWAWREHRLAAKLVRRRPEQRMVLLIDEPETHLHPRWQRRLVPALLAAVDTIRATDRGETQLIATTHAPLVLASMETKFDTDRDALFDLDLVHDRKGAHVRIRRRPWRRLGDVNSWLTSELFDLAQPRSVESEAVIARAARLLDEPKVSTKEARAVDQALREVLGDTDPFWIRWRFVGEKRGWLR